MTYAPIALAITTVVAVAACSPSGNPQLDMCKKIAGNLIAGNVEFGEFKETKGKKVMEMVLPYSSDGASSEAVCTFAAEKNHNSYTTSPKTVIIDGVQIGTKDLMRASLASSKEVLKDSADEASRKACLLYTSPSPRDQRGSRMPSSA